MAQNYSSLLEKSLDESRLELLHLLAHHASLLQMPLYLVGGVVRDLLLEYPVKEFDLVVEGGSAVFAEYVVKKIGGRVLVHPKFKTATWTINESTLKRLDFPAFQQTDFSLSFDLVSARSETYSYPGALPKIKLSNINDDLRRRDFTINAMAMRLDGNHLGELLDPLNGRDDLEKKLIRILHARSFIDDPTRMFRAVRYAMRYGFSLEKSTRQALYDKLAREALSRLSGERIRHEFDVIFEEKRPLLPLAALDDGSGLVKVVHPAMDGGAAMLTSYMEDIQSPPGGLGTFDIPDIFSFRQTLGWVLYLLHLSEDDINSIAERLAFPVLLTESVRAASSLSRDIPSFKNCKPSQWTFHLDKLPSLAIYAVWLITSEQPLHDYLEKWKNLKPHTYGDDLKRLGLEPGPRYKEILSRLRAAWLDGEVKSEAEEIKLRNHLIAE